MISRKDDLLKRPWQQRKFEYHRYKVKSALPAIDTGPPAYRNHVVLKLKKQQKESERCKKIEHENFLLLQKMNYITKSSRIDNVWKTPQPNFLNRVAIYNTVVPKIEDIDLDVNLDNENEEMQHIRKSKCTACTPNKDERIHIKDSEERIPWEPVKKPIGRVRSKSVPVRKPESLPSIKNETVLRSDLHSSKNSGSTKKTERENVGKFDPKAAQSIVLTSGCLKLSLSFPSDSIVKYSEKNKERYLMRGLCSCKNSPAPIL